jgi:ketosteroid isomerase-like protein
MKKKKKKKKICENFQAQYEANVAGAVQIDGNPDGANASDSEAAASVGWRTRLSVTPRRRDAVGRHSQSSSERRQDWKASRPGGVSAARGEATGGTGRTMSQENVEVVRRMHESLGGSELRFPAGFLDPHVEWVNPPYAAEPGIRRGKPAFEQAAANVSGAFDEFSFEDDEIIDLDDRILVLTTFVVHGRRSGIEHRQPQGYLWTLRDGRAIRFEWFNGHAEALEAAGL